MPILKTRSMEAAAIMLAGRFDRVLVHSVYALSKPVRLRLKLLLDIKPYLGRTSKAGDSQIERWRENGGVLINYRMFLNGESYDAKLFCEAPILFNTLNDDVPVVVYRPPSWRGHIEELSRLYPPSAVCRKLCREIRLSGMDAWPATICDALGFDAAGVSAITDQDLCKKIGVGTRHLRNIRKAVFIGYREHYFTVLPIVPNLEPADKTLQAMYGAICALPESNGNRLAVNGALSKHAKFWKQTVAALSRCGSVSVKPMIGFYSLAGVAPDYVLIQARYEAAKASLAKVIEAVDAAPELTVSRLEELYHALPAPLPPSGAHAQPEAGARVPDITG